MVTIWILNVIWIIGLIGIGVLVWKTEGEQDEYDIEDKKIS